jgi:putative transposase
LDRVQGSESVHDASAVNSIPITDLRIAHPAAIWGNLRLLSHSRADRVRHDRAAKAEDLATQGKLQSEIARALGVSVMTLHRWRKLPSQSNGSSQIDQTPQTRLAELQLENSRLRRLVTDLLLEKMKLKEVSRVGEPSMRWASQ